MDQKEALELLQKYVSADALINHCKGVSSFAKDLAGDINHYNPQLKIDIDKVSAAAMLHDIGRCREGDHEENTVAILKEEGLDDLAAIAMHGYPYEINLIRGQDRPELLPKSIENKIVVYSDFRFVQRLVTLDERFNDIRKRYSQVPEVYKASFLAEPRFKNIENELLSLAKWL